MTIRKVFIGCLLVSVLLLLLPNRVTEPLDRGVAMILGPLGRAGQDASLAVTKQVETLQRKSVSPEQYETLRREFLRAERETLGLRQQIQQQQEWIERFTGVRQEFGLSQARLIGAEILTDESGGHRRLILANRGQKDNVRAGQLVLGLAVGEKMDSPNLSVGSLSVIGRVASVTEATSHIQLLSDPEFSLAVSVEPNPHREDKNWKARGVLQGDALRGIMVKMISTQHPVQVGDVVFATAEPGALPAPLLVGVVDSCKRDDKDPILWSITVRPGPDLKILREVIMVDPFRGEKPTRKK